MAPSAHTLTALIVAAFLSAGPYKADRSPLDADEQPAFTDPFDSSPRFDKQPPGSPPIFDDSPTAGASPIDAVSVPAASQPVLEDLSTPEDLPEAEASPIDAGSPLDADSAPLLKASQPAFKGIKEHIQNALAAHSLDISKSAEEASRLAGNVASGIDQYHKDVKDVSSNMNEMDKVATDLEGKYSALLDRGADLQGKVLSDQEHFVTLTAEHEAIKERERGDAQDGRASEDGENLPSLQDAQADAAEAAAELKEGGLEPVSPYRSDAAPVMPPNPDTEAIADLIDQLHMKDW